MKFYFKKTKNNKKNKGVVLVFTIIVIIVVLNIFLGLSNMLLKEINFSISAISSNESFYAANSGVECALYYDLKLSQANQLDEDLLPVDNILKCSNQEYIIENIVGNNVDFIINNLGVNGNACAIVKIIKTSDGSGGFNTKIISKGYNVGGKNNCASDSSSKFEREIEINY